MKTQVISIVTQTSKKSMVVYASIALLLLVVYLIGGIRLQNEYLSLENKRYALLDSLDSLREEILLADLELNKLKSLERIDALAKEMHLDYVLPLTKISLDKGGNK